MENGIRRLTNPSGRSVRQEISGWRVSGACSPTISYWFLVAKNTLRVKSLLSGNKRIVHVLLIAFFCLTGNLLAELPNGKALEERKLIQEKILPFITEHCVQCHGGEEPQAGLSLEAAEEMTPVQQHHDRWENVLRRIISGEMPPPGEPVPNDSDRQQLKLAVFNMLSDAGGFRDPGRVTIRRLNRTEYTNTVRDLFGLSFALPDDFPTDDVGYGFDHIGDVLSLSPLLLEKYLMTGNNIASEVVLVPEAIQQPSALITTLNFGGGVVSGAKGRVLFSEGRFTAEHEFPRDGIYLLKARAWAEQAGDEPVRMTFRLGEQVLKTVEVRAEPSDPQLFTVWAETTVGKHAFSVSYDNDYYRPDDPNPLNRDRNLWVEYFEVIGPMDESMQTQKIPDSHRRIFDLDDEPPLSAEQYWERWSQAVSQETTAKILMQFASRAYRRPATAEEVARLVSLVGLVEQAGGSFQRGVQLAIQAVLVSPKFLFLGEFDPAPDDPREVRLVNEYELASRLSYFLWSSMPDRELMHHAQSGSLRANLSAQVLRMLRDSRSRSLVENFGVQWLQLRDLENSMIDTEQFPEFDDRLRVAMRTETEMFFASIIEEDRSVVDFIDGRYTFLNEILAKHYDIEGIEGEAFRRVALDGSQRSGVLTHASVLTLTSNPTRTSPVKRGKWVLKQLMGSPPPPPPPGVDELSEDDAQNDSVSLRQRLEKHRSKETCATCHARMDPLGFSLEKYDAIGRWRNKDGEHLIDDQGTLPDGREFNGSTGIKEILKADVMQFRWCVAEKMLIFALGRGMDYYDYRAVHEITETMVDGEDRFSVLVMAVINSHPFQFRRGDGGER